VVDAGVRKVDDMDHIYGQPARGRGESIQKETSVVQGTASVDAWKIARSG